MGRRGVEVVLMKRSRVEKGMERAIEKERAMER